MNSLMTSLSDHLATVVGVGFLIIIGLLISHITLFRKINRLHRQWRQLMVGASGVNLEQLLAVHLNERVELRDDLSRILKRTDILEGKMLTSKRHVGLVRYDAFEDVGGAQSFALAIFDDRGDGAIVSGLVGRNDCRVYCKPMQNGQSERTLSQEEQRAIQEAKSVGPKTIVTT